YIGPAERLLAMIPGQQRSPPNRRSRPLPCTTCPGPPRIVSRRPPPQEAASTPDPEAVTITKLSRDLCPFPVPAELKPLTSLRFPLIAVAVLQRAPLGAQ